MIWLKCSGKKGQYFYTFTIIVFFLVRGGAFIRFKMTYISSVAEHLDFLLTSSTLNKLWHLIDSSRLLVGKGNGAWYENKSIPKLWNTHFCPRQNYNSVADYRSSRVDVVSLVCPLFSFFSRWDNFWTLRVTGLKLCMGTEYGNLLQKWTDGKISTTPTTLPPSETVAMG